ncbi:MAG: hypothetical protein ACT4QF_13120 [Sporichthyaceae bacterium]
MLSRRSPKDSPSQQVPAQASAAEQPEAAPAQAPEASVPAQQNKGIEDVQDQIRRLANLRQLGVLSDEEFSGLTAVLLDLP